MWIDLNSILYIDYSAFFKVPYIIGQNNLNPCKLLYNSSIDKFFLITNSELNLIYLDKSESYNSYISSYLFNDSFNYRSKLKPYNKFLYNLQYNTIIQGSEVSTSIFKNLYSFQTEDEQYVTCICKLPINISENYVSNPQQNIYRLYVINKADFEDNIILHYKSGIPPHDVYTTDNFYDKSNGIIHYITDLYSSYTNSIEHRLDSLDMEVKNTNHFYIKNNLIPDNNSELTHRNVLPIWDSVDTINYVFDTTKNDIPDDIPEILTIGFDNWEWNLDFLSSVVKLYINSFEDDYSNKEEKVRYGFLNSYVYASTFYKQSTNLNACFVIEPSKELGGYKLFDINNPNAGYFLCSDNNCLKEQTSYRFKAFLNENIYREDIFNYYKNNDLILTWNSLKSIKNTFLLDSYRYCLNKIKKLSTIYNTQIPFIRF